MRKLNLILCVLLGVNLAYANDIICKDSSIESKPVSNVIKWYVFDNTTYCSGNNFKNVKTFNEIDL